MQFKYFLIFLSSIPNSLYAAHILSIFAVPIATQYDFVEPLLKELAARGHKITSISNYPQKEKLENFRDVVVEKNKHLFDEYLNFTVESIDANYYETVDEIYQRVFQICTNFLCDPMVRHTVDNGTYDLIIIDVLFSESLYGFSEYLHAPIVGVSVFGAVIPTDELVGNISPLSYIPEFILNTNEMGFRQRFLNILIHFEEWMYYHYKYMPTQKQIYKSYFPNATLTFVEAQKNVSLVLINDHFSLTQSRPYVPNMVEVAGLNIQAKPKPLIGDIKQLLDSARHGAIILALDLMIDPNTIKVLLKQFNKISNIILWKTSQYIGNTSKNVFINGSLNLPSIMAHPNIRLFIAPCSFLSVTESVYYGIPLLGITSTSQGSDYVHYVKKVGNGLSLKLHSISERNLEKAFQELLYNPHYTNVAKTLSLRFRDQQNTPMERAVYWIEYVLRHNGAAHLKNRGQGLTWWQFYNVDVYIVLFCLFILVIILVLLIFKLIIERIWNMTLNRNSTQKKKNN